MRGIKILIAQQRRSMSTPILHKSLDDTKRINININPKEKIRQSSYSHMYKHLPPKHILEQFKKNPENKS